MEVGEVDVVVARVLAVEGRHGLVVGARGKLPGVGGGGGGEGRVVLGADRRGEEGHVRILGEDDAPGRDARR